MLENFLHSDFFFYLISFLLLVLIIFLVIRHKRKKDKEYNEGVARYKKEHSYCPACNEKYNAEDIIGCIASDLKWERHDYPAPHRHYYRLVSVMYRCHKCSEMNHFNFKAIVYESDCGYSQNDRGEECELRAKIRAEINKIFEQDLSSQIDCDEINISYVEI